MGLVAAARRHHQAAILARAIGLVGPEKCQAWVERILETMPNGQTRMEWLRTGPASRKPKGLADHIAKIGFLKQLGADRLDLGISTVLLKALARAMLYRKPATVRRMRSARKTLEIACFLRLQLLRLIDDGLGMIDYRIADLWRRARTRAEAAQAEELRRHQHLVLHLLALTEDVHAPEIAWRDRLRSMLMPFLPMGRQGRPTQIGRIRRQLALDRDGAVEILGAVRAIGVEHAPDHPLAQALVTLERIDAAGDRHLPAGTVNPFGQTWAHLVSQPDRDAALGGYRAATLMLVKRACAISPSRT